MSDALGRLEVLRIREIWANEASDFTPWLLDNADVLSEALGMDLALDVAEHPVGDFSLDLIGTDRRNGESVIIENQLTESDHKHLGQIMTYAGGTEATNIVWVATRFREEHRAALEWLNERTDERTRFFAVTIELVRIGNSIPAPRLTLVVRPNDWGKQVRATHPLENKWQEQDFFARLADLASPAVCDAARALYDHTRAADKGNGWAYWGAGQQPNMTAQIPVETSRLQPWSFDVSSGVMFAINFDWIHKGGQGVRLNAMDVFAGEIRSLPGVETAVEQARAADWRRRPSVEAEALFKDPASVTTFMAALDGLYADARASSNGLEE